MKQKTRLSLNRKKVVKKRKHHYIWVDILSEVINSENIIKKKWIKAPLEIEYKHTPKHGIKRIKRTAYINNMLNHTLSVFTFCK